MSHVERIKDYFFVRVYQLFLNQTRYNLIFILSLYFFYTCLSSFSSYLTTFLSIFFLYKIHG